MADLAAALRNFVIASAGPSVAGTVDASSSIVQHLNVAAATFRQGRSGQLPLQAQQAFNQWRAQVEPSESSLRIAWVFAERVVEWQNALVSATNDQLRSGLLNDPEASKAVFTLMDTTQSGTTWFGGTTTASKLTNGQWAGVFEIAFNALAKGITGGVLPLTYLDVLCKAMLTQDIVRRKFPVFSTPPGNVPLGDPKAIAFRAMLKQIGWSGVTRAWFTFTQQAWVEENARSEAQDAQLAAAITALNYVSGAALLDKVRGLVEDYFAARKDAVEALVAFDQLDSGPLAAEVPPADREAMDAIRGQFGDLDSQAFKAFNPIGLWPEGTTPTALGAAQFIIGGAILVTVAGFAVWIVSMMTATSRSAAEQTRKTMEHVLSTVDQVKASCLRVYNASPKSAADEAVLQKCLENTKELLKTIPPPPSGGDPLGLKWLSLLAVVGIGGFIAYQKFGKK